jgi:hypothetical protein
LREKALLLFISVNPVHNAPVELALPDPSSPVQQIEPPKTGKKQEKKRKGKGHDRIESTWHIRFFRNNDRLAGNFRWSEEDPSTAWLVPSTAEDPPC